MHKIYIVMYVLGYMGFIYLDSSHEHSLLSLNSTGILFVLLMLDEILEEIKARNEGL